MAHAISVVEIFTQFCAAIACTWRCNKDKFYSKSALAIRLNR